MLARPLFFLIISVSINWSRVAEQIITGLTKACRAAGCVLIGGETAEMPIFINPVNTILWDVLSG